MASCTECNSFVSCSCSLIQGKCLNCYTEQKAAEEPTNPEYLPFNAESTTITEVAQSTGIPKEEQLRRINEILLNARNKIIEDVNI